MDEDTRISLGLRGRSECSVSTLPLPNPNIPSVISASGISCKNGKNKIWKNLSFFINGESITALTGHNGAGKTTLALVLSGLSCMQDGYIRVDGKRASRANLRKTVYYCSNDTVTQFFTNSVSEELLLNMKQNKKTICDAKDLLKRMHLYKYKDVHPQSLSGGQRQRLAVCCALLSEKKILIFDEPTSGLDGRNMLLIAEQLKNAVKNGKTVLVITHDEEFISKCCDYRLCVDEMKSMKK